MVAERPETLNAPQGSSRVRYTDGQKRAIAAELSLSDQEANAAIDRIELIVSLARDALNYRKEHPIPDWLHAKFRSLDKPIKEILAVIERPESEYLGDHIPNLRGDLKFLLGRVEEDARPAKRPFKPGKSDRIWVVSALAGIWAESHGWPKRWGAGAQGRDQGKFYPFLDACLNPAAIDVTDRIIREVIEEDSITGRLKSP